MTVNPDNKDYMGKVAFLKPTEGMLRFVNGAVPTENEHVMKKARILQRYEWSAELRRHDWFEVPMFED